jgi:ADP-heptose:LPS heptosyltransferase
MKDEASGAVDAGTSALVLRALGVGDLLTAVPALRALRRHGLRLTLAAPPELRDLVALTGAVDSLVPAYGLEPLSRRDHGAPALAVNLHGRGPQSHRLLLGLRPRRVWAFAHPDVPQVKGPQWADGEHEMQRWCRLVGWYGALPDPDDFLLPVPMYASPAPGAIVIHPGGKGTERRWPPQRFAEVARALRAQETPIVLTGGRRERSLALHIATAAALPSRVVLAGRTSLRELCALVSRARLVISADTGIAHLATAYGTPSVTIFGPETPARWGPPPGRPWHRPLRRGPDPAQVTAADVLEAAAAALSAATAPAGT